MLTAEIEIIDFALDYARRGWAVIPLHAPTQGGCSCRNPNCANVGKHPRTAQGLKAASCDSGQVVQWWTQWPEANTGIVCGALSGIVVLDVDGPQGEDTLEDLEHQLGPLPETVEALTGKGRHLYFKHPGGRVRPSAGVLGPGMDVRGDDSYVVGPGSLHHTGRRYLWEATHGPEDVALAELPEAWATLLRDKPRAAASARAPLTILEGERNTALTRMAGALRRQGADEDAILAALLTANTVQCVPPLGVREVETIARSVGRYKPMPKPAAQGEPEHDGLRRIGGLTDMGNAERFKRLHENAARYCHVHGTWYVWDGARWKADDEGRLGLLGKAVVRDLLKEAAAIADDEQRKQTVAWAYKLESAAKQKAMFELARSEVPVTVEQMDAGGDILNCLNGMVDLRTGELLPHDKGLFPTKVCPVAFDAAARSAVFESFLDRIQPERETRRFLQRALGYSLLNGNPEEAIFIVCGPPAAGKSTLLEAVAVALGDYAEQADVRTFLEKRHDDGGARPGLAKLRGARFVRSAEVPRGEKLATQLMKWISGGDRVSARFLFGNEFTFLPSFTVWIGTNFAPEVPDDDAAIWRRIHRIPFTQEIPEAERDPEIKKVLQDPVISGAAILAWLVEGCLDYLRNGLQVPEAVRAETEKYRRESDPLEGFFEECCALRSDLWAKSGDLWEAYEKWSVGNERVIGRREFARRLDACGLRAAKGTGGVRIRWGIRLLGDDCQE
jgi:putative DNA primase/helicase